MPINSTIRGHQAKFIILQNQQRVVIDTITRVSISQNSSFSQHNYVGQRLPQGDQTFMGWSGSISMEVKDDTIELFIDALVANNLTGIGVTDYALLVVEEYSDGHKVAYSYTDCQFKLSGDIGGLDSKVTKTLDFQCSVRARVNRT